MGGLHVWESEGLGAPLLWLPAELRARYAVFCAFSPFFYESLAAPIGAGKREPYLLLV